MRNKSRKQILHEQKVEIERLRRWVKRLQMQIDPFVGVDRHQIDTLERSFAVPQGLIESDRIRDLETYKALKEMVQALVGHIEIRCEDIYRGEYQEVTLSLRVIRPSCVDPSSEDYLKRMVPKIVRFPDLPYHDERDMVCYGGPHDGGKKHIEELCLLMREAKMISVGGEWGKDTEGGE